MVNSNNNSGRLELEFLLHIHNIGDTRSQLICSPESFHEKFASMEAR